MIVVDSSVWIAHLRGDLIAPVRTLRSLDEADSIIVGDLILLELLQGARNDDHARRIEQGLRQFPIMPMLGTDLAIKAARNSRTLRAAGLTIRKTIDMIIATFCIEHGFALLQHDRDFEAIASRLKLRLL